MDKIVIIGFGIQGRKRKNFFKKFIVSIVDPIVKESEFKRIEEVPLDIYDTAFVCVPDNKKEKIVKYLVINKKNIFVEKPLFPIKNNLLKKLHKLSVQNKKVFYVSYNHRFEPNLIDAKKNISYQRLGEIYYINFCYGNGTVIDILNTKWKNNGFGVIVDLGSHILDLLHFFEINFSLHELELLLFKKFEAHTNDHVIFKINSNPVITVELSSVSWRNNFTLNCIGSKGSFHSYSLCKWGPSKSIYRKRVFPSGRPTEITKKYNMYDPTWLREWDYFKSLFKKKKFGIEKKEFFLNNSLEYLVQLGAQQNEK